MHLIALDFLGNGGSGIFKSSWLCNFLKKVDQTFGNFIYGCGLVLGIFGNTWATFHNKMWSHCSLPSASNSHPNLGWAVEVLLYFGHMTSEINQLSSFQTRAELEKSWSTLIFEGKSQNLNLTRSPRLMFTNWNVISSIEWSFNEKGFTTMKICPIEQNICQSRFKIFPYPKGSFKIARDFLNFANVANFRQILFNNFCVKRVHLKRSFIWRRFFSNKCKLIHRWIRHIRIC